jgi:hypothetical protein
MSQQSTIVALLERGRGMMRKHLADFTDAEMFARVAPAANHAAYQLAHLLRTTKGMVQTLSPQAQVTLPAKVEGDAKAPPASNDPTAFPGKEELLSAYENLFTQTVEAIKSMADADLDKPTPEHFKNFAPTVAQLALMLPLHMSMHVGQIQSIRRVLGKPVLF